MHRCSSDGWSVEFETLQFEKLKNILGSIRKNTCDSDGISLRILKLSFETVGNHLLDLINISLKSGKFPESWKVATVVPVEKIKNSKLCDEYRPINTLPIYEKVLELTVKDQLLNYIEGNNILIRQQSGFRSAHSCETALQFLISDWKKAIQSGFFVGIVFLDFKRAFETINRGLLLLKLHKYGINGKVHEWLTSYLTNRLQRVKYGNAMSVERGCELGVPQGSVLGPLLFIMFINDICHHVKNCQIKLFADDTLLYFVGEVNEIESALNKDLKDLITWLNDSGLLLNISKSKFMLLGSKNRISSLSHPGANKINISINNEQIEQVNSFRYLGVTLDPQLNFDLHCDGVRNVMARKVNFLFRLDNKISSFAKLTIYKSVIAPTIDYCGTLLYFVKNEAVNSLQKIQNRAMRAILQCNKKTPINKMLEALSLMSIKQRINYNMLVFVFKLSNNLVPEYLTEGLQYGCDIHDYNTRNKNNFYISSENVRSDTILSRGLVLFNSLPTELRECQQLHVFKIKCVKYVKETF